MKQKRGLICILCIIFLLSIFSVSASNNCITTPTTSLISWWPGDGNTTDIVAGHNGTLRFGATFGTGNVGQGFKFDGVNDYVNITDDPDWELGNQNVTINFWVIFNATDKNQKLFGQQVDDGNMWYMTFDGVSTGLRFFTFSGGVKIVDVGAGNTNGWVADRFYMVSMVKRGNNFTVYRNATVIASDIGTGVAIPNFVGDVAIGIFRPPTNAPTNGTIDEVQLYNEALTVVDLESIFNASSDGICKTTVVDTFDGSTTNFNAESNLSSVSNMILEVVNKGKIVWNNSVDARFANLDNEIEIGSGFVSLDAAVLDASYNSSVNVSVDVIGCGTWTIYHAGQPVTSLTQLKSVGSQIGSGTGVSGSCTSLCSNPTCDNNVLSFTISHLDSAGGEGSGIIPEFSTILMIMSVSLVLIGFIFMRRKI